MAVRLEGPIKRYVGLARDKKPIPYSLGGEMAQGDHLPPGSVFYEEDMDRSARWDGSRWHYPKDTLADIFLMSQTIVERLDRIVALLTTNKAKQKE